MRADVRFFWSPCGGAVILLLPLLMRVIVVVGLGLKGGKRRMLPVLLKSGERWMDVFESGSRRIDLLTTAYIL
jgi:hypothetical protein